jgi:hypothetical protein
MFTGNASNSGLSSTLSRLAGLFVLSLAALLLTGCGTMAAENSAATSTANTATVTAASLAFTVQPSSAAQSTQIAPVVQVAIRSASGSTVTTATNTVTLKLTSGTGLTGTLTAVAVKGIATFSNLSVTSIGTFTVVASSPNLTSATSQSFKITIPTTPHTAVASDAVVDSVGINVHLSYAPSPYQNFAAVEDALVNLQIRHLRDGLAAEAPTSPYIVEHNLLGQLGIDSIFTTSVGQSAALIQSFPPMLTQCFAGYDSPNEYDIQSVANWVPPLKAQLQVTSNAVRSPNVSKRYPVIGPSLVQTASYPQLGNISQYVDYGNLHNYPGGRNPGTAGWGGLDAQGNAYGSIPWNLDQLAMDAPNLPYYTTETGYTNDLTIPNSVPQSVSAVYMPRLILEQWRAGFTRTFLYELVSEGGEDYGLISSNWQRKPAYYALANLLVFLYDRGHTFKPGSLNYGIAGGDSNLHQLLMQRHDGTFFLALWLEEPSYNVNTRTAIAVAPEPITIQLPAGSQYLDYVWDATGAMTQVRPTQSTPLNLTITDKLQILEIVVPK